MFGNKVKATLTTTALSIAAAGFMAGCGIEEEQTAYCVDEDNNVVDEDNCDNSHGGGGGYFFLYGGFGGNSYHSGDRITGSGHSRVSASDSSARSRAGLPSSGKVSAGSRVSGGIGKGSGGGSGGG